MSSLSEIIMTRKSVRTFDGTPLKAEDREKLETYAKTITNPFGIPVEFVFMDAEKCGLSSPVLTGEKLYVAGIVPKTEHADTAFGYAFEQLVIYAWSLGIGTTWIGGTMKRETFEKAAGLTDDKMMPCISPLGCPAKKRGFRESMMRKGVKADSRMETDKLFFDASLGRLTDQKKNELRTLIDLVRWAPSAVNKQPWRVIADKDCCHFYVKHDKGYVSEATGDLQKIDVGIALCHFVLGAEELGMKAEVSVSPAGFSVPADWEYVATVQLLSGPIVSQ